MKKDKQIKEFAKKLLKLSLDGEDLSPERVNGVLQSLSKNPPRHHLAILKHYLKFVQREIAKATAVVTHAGTLSPAAIDAIKSRMTAKYGRSISVVANEDPSLIAGLRVVVDCDVYESSIASALSSLQTSLS